MHISSNSEKDPKIDPPIHAAYCLYGGDITLTVYLSATKDATSFCNRSPNPGNEVERPERTTLRNRSL